MGEAASSAVARGEVATGEAASRLAPLSNALSLSIEQYCSAHIGALHHAMIAQIRADGGVVSAGTNVADIELLPHSRLSLVIDHSQLPSAVLDDLLPHFGLAMDEPSIQTAIEWSRINSKDPSTAGYTKRAIAPATRRWAEAYAAVTYATMRASATLASSTSSGGDSGGGSGGAEDVALGADEDDSSGDTGKAHAIHAVQAAVAVARAARLNESAGIGRSAEILEQLISDSPPWRLAGTGGGASVGGDQAGTSIQHPGESSHDSEVSAIASCLEWSLAQGVGLFGLAVSSTPGSGLGLVATRDLSAGELLLRVPHKLLLTGEGVAGAGGTNALALALLAERFKGADSPWATYVQLLNSMDAVGTPLFFNASERALLRGTEVLGWSLARETNVDRTHRFLSSQSAPHIRRQDLDWALSIAWSRGFTIRTRAAKSPRPSLVPMGDLFNHAPEIHANVLSQSDPTREVFEYYATRAMRAGEEALFSYSQHGEPSNSKVCESIALFSIFLATCSTLIAAG